MLRAKGGFLQMDISYLIILAIIGFVIWFQFGLFYKASKSLGIRATPTLVMIENGFIQKVLLGSQSEAKLRSLLEQ